MFMEWLDSGWKQNQAIWWWTAFGKRDCGFVDCTFVCVSLQFVCDSNFSLLCLFVILTLFLSSSRLFRRHSPCLLLSFLRAFSINSLNWIFNRSLTKYKLTYFIVLKVLLLYLFFRLVIWNGTHTNVWM